jgi:hypothetical protein
MICGRAHVVGDGSGELPLTLLGCRNRSNDEEAWNKRLHET